MTGKVRLEADRAELERFIEATFRYADEARMPCCGPSPRAPTRCSARYACRSTVALDALVDNAMLQATEAANARRAAVFARSRPSSGAARAEISATAWSSASRPTMRPRSPGETWNTCLGSATVVVASGGQWIDPQTGVVEDKLHLHWRCREPSRSASEHASLKRARARACTFVGADATAVSLVHPLRWPGGWHRKNEPRLARIVALNPDVEIDPSEAIELLEPLIPVPPTRGPSRVGTAAIAELDEHDLAALSEIIANADREWADWNRLGMAFFAASGGSDAGFAGFDHFLGRAPSTTRPRRSDAGSTIAARHLIGSARAPWSTRPSGRSDLPAAFHATFACGRKADASQ